MAVKTNWTNNGKPCYRIQKTVGYRTNEHGKQVPVRKSFIGNSKKEAEEKYASYMEKKTMGLESRKQYFGIVADNWISSIFWANPSIADSTKELYVNAWNKYIKPSSIYHLPLEEITPSVLQKLYNGLGAPISSLKAANKLMKRFYKYLDREGLARDITGSIELPRVPSQSSDSEIIIWTEEELRLILNNLDNATQRFRLKFLIILAINTGARISELLGVKYSDITEEGLLINRQVISVPTVNALGEVIGHELSTGATKSKRSRLIPLNSEVKKALADHKAWHKEEMLKEGYRTDFVFTSNNGSLYYRRNVSKALNRYYKKINVTPKGVHTYRHTFGTTLCAKGEPIERVAELMGHTDLNITAKYYVKVSFADKQRAVELLSNIASE